MLVSCPRSKIEDLQSLCRKAMETSSITANECERLLGKMESVRPSTNLAALHYRPIQRQLLVLKSSWGEGNRFPNQVIELSEGSLLCLEWWISPSGFQNLSSSPVRELVPSLEIWTDANLEMCGAHSSRGSFYQRPSSPEELSQDLHINLLELRAAREGLANLASPGDRVRLYVDSTTALFYIRKQGGTRSLALANEAFSLW